MDENDNTLACKTLYNWAFKPDDWFVDIVLGNSDFRYRICTLKNYSAQKIDQIVYDIYNTVHVHRTELESKEKAFINKKKYLLLQEENVNNTLQITLDGEYALKELIDKYKIYTLISWMHLGKNQKIFKHCIMEKHKLLEQIFPLADLSIRKVIGAKVFKPFSQEFSEAVSNAWMSIIKYLTKIDTSKVMFSIFVKIAHRSAIFYRVTLLKHTYNNTSINNILSSNEESNEDLFINSVIHNNVTLQDDSDSEYDAIDKEIEEFIDNSSSDCYIEDQHSEIDEMIYTIDENKGSVLQQNIIAKSYDILSGKIKKLCYEKIFAEFFIDLINNQINEEVLKKHVNVIMNVIDTANKDSSVLTDDEANEKLYKFFKDWMKDKIKVKLIRFANTDQTSSFMQDQISEAIKREKTIIKYLKDNKHEMIKNFLLYKNKCLDFIV